MDHAAATDLMDLAGPTDVMNLAALPLEVRNRSFVQSRTLQLLSHLDRLVLNKCGSLSEGF